MSYLARAAEPMCEDFLTAVKCLRDVSPIDDPKRGQRKVWRLRLTRHPSIEPMGNGITGQLKSEEDGPSD